MQPRPEISEDNAAFWTGGGEGRLMIAHCAKCDRAIHPPQPICPKCLSTEIESRGATGTGTVLACTINRQQWSPDTAVPYALGIVALDGEDGVRITARIEAEPESVAIGDRVKVAFAALDDVWRPYFVPA